jgi:hypothetical protein
LTQTSSAITALNFFGHGGIGASTKNPPTAPGSQLEKGDVNKQVSFSQQYFMTSTQSPGIGDNENILLRSAAFIREEQDLNNNNND